MQSFASSIPPRCRSRPAIPMWSRQPLPRASSIWPVNSGSTGTATWSAGGDFRAQAVQTFENLKAALAAVGGRFTHVVKLNNYLTDIVAPADFPRGARQLSAGDQQTRQHDHVDFEAGAAGRAVGDRGGSDPSGRRASETRGPDGRKAAANVPSTGRPRDGKESEQHQHRQQTRRRPDQVTEEARHLDAALDRDRIHHEVRRVADVGDARPCRRRPWRSRPASRRAGSSARARCLRRVRRTPDRSAALSRKAERTPVSQK